MNAFPIPVLGICAYSGTGKTTLLTHLLPLLKNEGLRIGMVKHAHHNFEIDKPNKDSFRLREAGADQVMIASRNLKAWICKRENNETEPDLEEVLRPFETANLDLILVEGFKKISLPKIELHRPSLGLPLIFPNDENVIAIACDSKLDINPGSIPLLDLNLPSEIKDFIVYDYLQVTRQQA
ncbi:MAG: molybdopterin-guanine dinucleotide biosynthesis protein B [Gammaproteobacteria bacterium]|jgi:molybdopterin-guanine dinucleotide biosynthesis adapter protein